MGIGCFEGFCGSIHGTVNKAIPARQVKIKTVAFSQVCAIGKLEGNETTALNKWLGDTDLNNVGLSESADLDKPGEWLCEFTGLENNYDEKLRNRSSIFFRVGDKGMRSERAFSSRSPRSTNRMGAHAVGVRTAH